MRILVADQNALLLAAIAATFGRHCEVVTATCRDACMEHVEQGQFDVVVACEKLGDYTGLELLSEIEAVCPATLRIFAARPESLRRLGKRLDLFELFGTLSYPIEARKLVVALKVARTKLPARPKAPIAPPVVRHIVLETEWDTGERLALLEQELDEAPAPDMVATETLEVSFNEDPSPPPDTEVTQCVGEESPPIHFAAKDESVEAPPPEVRVEPGRPYCGDLAANAEAFVEAPAPAETPSGQRPSTTMAPVQPQAPPVTISMAPQPGASRAAALAKLAGATAMPAAGAKNPTAAKGPRARKPTTPTAAQREAFQRALARRNAARSETPPIDFSNVRVPNAWLASGFGASPSPPQSLKDIARMATTKRPLPGAVHARQKLQPKRGAFVVGSGIVAVLLVGVVSFELLRAGPPVEHGRHAHAGAVQLFSPNSTLVAGNSAGSAQVFSPPPQQPDQAPAAAATPGMPQPQTFNPDTAPPDPPPPPALEHPGPMEPPSMAHYGPPIGMQGAPDASNGWNSE